MYQYTASDRQLVQARALEFRDQLTRHLAGQLSEDAFKPLRLQNGWYVQRHAPMLRVAVPYGALNARQLRLLAQIAREFDLQDAGTPRERGGFGHFTTRQNLQFNWIPLHRAADVMDRLASVDMHGIQTSGNCIRNITSDALAGVAPDEVVDPRPYCEVLRQWSTLHPEFTYLPRKFKIAVSGAREDRAALRWHDVGLQLVRNPQGDVGFEVYAGGGMGRTPTIAPLAKGFVPWHDILLYLEALVRVYNLYGRRDNLYKARIKILVKAEGAQFFAAVDQEFAEMLADDAVVRAHRIPPTELERIAARFTAPQIPASLKSQAPTGHVGSLHKAYTRWLQRNVHAHRQGHLRAVTLSLKRAGLAPGDVTADQMEQAAELAERFSAGELRVSHDQNLVLPWVSATQLPELWEAAKARGFATPNVGLLTDMIACPGGDYCALANARSIPVAEAIRQRFEDLDHLHDIGDIDLHISGCINSCGHHHSGHLGILGVDKDGSEWYQVSVGGSDGSQLSGTATPGKIIGPAFAADEVPDVVEAVIDTYLRERLDGERFIDAVKRLGTQPFKEAADQVRMTALA
jgi:sulfite reductase (NADPH) hemoprotein beta-component